MKRPVLHTALALAVVVFTTPLAVHAQVATTPEQAELARLKPDVRAEVHKRLAASKQRVIEILTTMLLNNIKLKHPASRIVALDFGRGAALVDGLEVVNFDTTTLQIKP